VIAQSKPTGAGPVGASALQLARRLRFKQLALLVALDDHRNLHRAAEAVHLTQPSATKVLHDVEVIFGFALFERLPRGMQPTPLGGEVVDFARRFLIELERFSVDLQHKRAGGFGQLVVGAIMGAAPDLVALAVIDMKKRRPLLAVKLLGETSDQVITLLEQCKIDLAVGRFSQLNQHNEIGYEDLGNEVLCAVARKGHPLAARTGLDLLALAEAAWVLQPLTSPARQIIEQEFGQAGAKTPADVVECSSIFATLQLVQKSDAVTVLPESVVRDHLAAGFLVRLPLVVGKHLPGFGILTRRGEPLSRAALEFIECLRGYGASLSRAQARSEAPGVEPLL
jgi:DNA-binding transcriptional LysR family regulator